MAAQELNCPSCGAPLAIASRFSRVVVCGYCGQVAEITPAGLDPTGQVSQLVAAPSVLRVGATGTLAGTPLEVLGRVRLKYEDGFWDEWFVRIGNDGSAWLQEDDGELMLFDKQRITAPVPPFDEVRVGTMVDVGRGALFVTERIEALVEGGEGELPFRVQRGEAVKCIDGSLGGSACAIEYTADELTLSTGTAYRMRDLSLDRSGA